MVFANLLQGVSNIQPLNTQKHQGFSQCVLPPSWLRDTCSVALFCYFSARATVCKDHKLWWADNDTIAVVWMGTSASVNFAYCTNWAIPKAVLENRFQKSQTIRNTKYLLQSQTTLYKLKGILSPASPKRTSYKTRHGHTNRATCTCSIWVRDMCTQQQLTIGGWVVS